LIWVLLLFFNVYSFILKDITKIQRKKYTGRALGRGAELPCPPQVSHLPEAISRSPIDTVRPRGLRLSTYSLYVS
jgi:hypothetical protein